ncbi:MAG: PEP-CTERM sorting domain-containing protein [Kiritimatiellia bacterium]
MTGNANNTFNGGLMLVNGNDPNTANAHNPTVIVNQEIVAVPEPSTYALALVGLVAALWRRRVKA